MTPEYIALYDMDNTLCDYDLAIVESMKKLQSPHELPYTGRSESHPEYIKAREDLIMSKTDWWTKMPKLQLGFDIWELTLSLGFHHMILTQGPKRNPKSWMAKKIWIDKHLGQNVDVTITRDKGLVYGKILVDDWPEYIMRWLEWRPRGIVIMPARKNNAGFHHPQVTRYDGSNLNEVKRVIVDKLLSDKK